MSNELNSDEPSAFQTKQFYQLLLVYVDSELASWEDHLPSIVAYLRRDGSIQFSVSSPIGIIQDVVEESRLSDRLLVIICVAYLEDQIRLALAKFLSRNDETDKLLDPANGPLLFLDAARLAFSLGLIAKEWLEILKEMAKLRNKFAHDPFAQSFENLIEKDSKQTWKSLKQLTELYKQIAQKELDGTIHDNFLNLFFHMYAMMQFSIDHLATENPRLIFVDSEIIATNAIMGFTRENIQFMIDNNFGQGQ